MNKQPLILALIDTSDPQSDPQLRMLADVPHIIANSREALNGSTADAEVILHWGGSLDLLKAAFRLLSQPFSISPKIFPACSAISGRAAGNSSWWMRSPARPSAS